MENMCLNCIYATPDKKYKPKWWSYSECQPMKNRKLIIIIKRSDDSGYYTASDVPALLAQEWYSAGVNIVCWRYMPKMPKEYR